VHSRTSQAVWQYSSRISVADDHLLAPPARVLLCGDRTRALPRVGRSADHELPVRALLRHLLRSLARVGGLWSVVKPGLCDTFMKPMFPVVTPMDFLWLDWQIFTFSPQFPQ